MSVSYNWNFKFFDLSDSEIIKYEINEGGSDFFLMMDTRSISRGFKHQFSDKVKDIMVDTLNRIEYIDYIMNVNRSPKEDLILSEDFLLLLNEVESVVFRHNIILAKTRINRYKDKKSNMDILYEILDKEELEYLNEFDGTGFFGRVDVYKGLLSSLSFFISYCKSFIRYSVVADHRLRIKVTVN